MKDKYNPDKIFSCPNCLKEIPQKNIFESICISRQIPQIHAGCPFCAKNLGPIAYRDSGLVKEILTAFVNWKLQKLAELRDLVVKE